MSIRKVGAILRKRPTLEGAGVRLNRIFGFSQKNIFDPFLLLDDFSGENPEDYIKGFPWHPHRGIETITYIISGNVEHQDSLGSKGNIRDNEIQWMTAGSGILHQEMPLNAGKPLQGFQLWANLPKSYKMMDPRYRDVTTDQITCEKISKGVTVKVIAGEVNGIRGPVQDVVIKPIYFDVSMEPNSEFKFEIPLENTAIVYIFEGKAQFGEEYKKVESGNLVELITGDFVQIKTGDTKARMLFISGKPIKETIAWYGPIVMNTQEELEAAFKEFRNGTFVKKKGKQVL
ncbi:MAG: pirin family protein [Candidatus Lokiarchaeota archaeon]|nr:pirin family protein [Candidatus Lokiarchaeota archaeon]